MNVENNGHKNYCKNREDDNHLKASLVNANIGTGNGNDNNNDDYNHTKNYHPTVEVTFSDAISNHESDHLVGNGNGFGGKPIIFDGNDGHRLRAKRLTIDDGDSIISTSTAVTGAAGKKQPEIPDGGFGWVVVVASFIISLIGDGIAFSFGLIYSELLAYFKESKAKTAWIGALFLAVPLLAGPVLSNLVDTYGCRRMTFIGGLLAGTGFALASICTSIEMLYVTFGLIAGCGIGIGYVTAVVSVAFWFDKKRKSFAPVWL